MLEVDSTFSTLRSVLSPLLGNTVTSADRVGGGHNGQVFKVICGESGQYAAKHYFRHPTDVRDRMKVEFSALEFLWDNGVRRIPEPVAADQDRQLAVYEWIEGEAISEHRIANAEIDEAVEFLEELHELTHSEGSKHLPAASEACFALRDTVANIRLRLNRLKEYEPVGGQAEGLQRFLADEFGPILEEVVDWCGNQHVRSCRSYDQELSLAERTLSPSDFGFHNALRRTDGQIVFVDFEYFGWDDPAKTVSDFLLHPAMNLTHDLKLRFVNGMLSRFRGAGDLESRLATFYPLFGLKWCLILLNEFLPEHLLRRDFADAEGRRRGALQATQLAKSKAMLAKVRDEYEHFPY